MLPLVCVPVCCVPVPVRSCVYSSASLSLSLSLSVSVSVPLPVLLCLTSCPSVSLSLSVCAPVPVCLCPCLFVPKDCLVKDVTWGFGRRLLNSSLNFRGALGPSGRERHGGRGYWDSNSTYCSTVFRDPDKPITATKFSPCMYICMKHVHVHDAFQWKFFA
jgi:hypothetical protein